jgi:hypothetical protein
MYYFNSEAMIGTRRNDHDWVTHCHETKGPASEANTSTQRVKRVRLHFIGGGGPRMGVW